MSSEKLACRISIRQLDRSGGVILQLVATGFAGIVTADTYTIRLQPLGMLSTSPTATVLNLCYQFNVGGGTTGTCAFSPGTGDNGNVAKVVTNRDTTRSQNFTYDSLNRIATPWTDWSTPTRSIIHCDISTAMAWRREISSDELSVKHGL